MSLNQYSIECLLRGSGLKWYVPIFVCDFHLCPCPLFTFLFMAMFLSMSIVPFFCLIFFSGSMFLSVSMTLLFVYYPISVYGFCLCYDSCVCTPMYIYNSYLHLCSQRFTWFLSVYDSFLCLQLLPIPIFLCVSMISLCVQASNQCLWFLFAVCDPFLRLSKAPLLVMIPLCVYVPISMFRNSGMPKVWQFLSICLLNTD